MVPFTIKPEHPDTELEAKLRLEWPGILRWMINGCLDWQEHGLPRPESVRTATEEYFADQDLIGQWMTEQCDVEIGNPYKSEMAGALFSSWSKFAKASGADPGSIKGFSQKLVRRGLVSRRIKSGTRFEFIKTNDPYDRERGPD
jgi:putative DNA primase/helicase